MSNLKLDFDLSGEGREDSGGSIFFLHSPKRRRAKSAQQQKKCSGTDHSTAKLTSSESQLLLKKDFLESTSSTSLLHEFYSTVQATRSTLALSAVCWRLVVLAGLVLVFFLWVVTSALGVSSSTNDPRALAYSKCVTRQSNVVCHAESCNLKGRCTGGPIKVIFDKLKCADAVRTVTAHEEDGRVQHYPAFLFRTYNTTEFRVVGKRVLFHPASLDCHARAERPKKKKSLDMLVSKGVHGAVVWISSGSYERYSVYRNEHLIATMEGSVALVQRFGSQHSVYKFEPACRHWDRYDREQGGSIMQVYAHKDRSTIPMETFVYC